MKIKADYTWFGAVANVPAMYQQLVLSEYEGRSIIGTADCHSMYTLKLLMVRGL